MEIGNSARVTRDGQTVDRRDVRMHKAECLMPSCGKTVEVTNDQHLLIHEGQGYSPNSKLTPANRPIYDELVNRQRGRQNEIREARSAGREAPMPFAVCPECASKVKGSGIWISTLAKVFERIEASKARRNVRALSQELGIGSVAATEPSDGRSSRATKPAPREKTGGKNAGGRTSLKPKGKGKTTPIEA